MTDHADPPSPAALVDTRLSLQQVAVHVLARRRHAATGRFGLRPSPGGLATPAFGDGPEVVRTSGAALVVEWGGDATVERLTTLGRAAEVAGVDLGAPFSVGRDTPEPVDPDAPLAVDTRAVRMLAGWWSFGATVLDDVAAADPGRGSTPLIAAATTAQLWPEHFDHAIAATLAGPRAAVVNLGASPGDAFEPLPYLYVGPHDHERPGDAGYWNAPFGAVLRREEIVGLPPGEQRARALAFLRRGIELLARG